MNDEITLSDYERLKQQSEYLYLHRKYLAEEIAKRDKAEENIASTCKSITQYEASIQDLVTKLGLGSVE